MMILYVIFFNYSKSPLSFSGPWFGVGSAYVAAKSNFALQK